MPDVDTGGYRKLSVIVPVFNERNTVVEIMRRMRAVELPLDREFVLVDDGSSDGTQQVLAPTRRQHGQGRQAHGEPRKGRGHPYRARARHGRSGAHPGRRPRVRPERLAEAAAPVFRGKATVVYGSRFTGERRNMLLLHWMGNRMLSLTTNVLYNTTLSDMETCYKLFDRRVLDGITIRSDRFDFEPRSPRRCCARVCASTRCRSRTPGREFDEGKKITWRDGFAACPRCVKFRFVR